MKRKTKTPLSTSQQQIIEIFWMHGEMTVSQVREQLALKGRDLARNTVQTLIVRMEEKGWLQHRSIGRTFFYTAAQSKDASLGQELKQLLDRSFSGSAEQLVNSLLETYTLKKGEADRIRKLIDQAATTQKKSSSDSDNSRTSSP